MILSNIRNTIHNNGTPISEERVFVYHNYTINFIYNYPQNVASYNILGLILSDFLKFFEEIKTKLSQNYV